MNTKTLEKHYDKLAPRERAVLSMNTFGHGDYAEAMRLVDTAPKVELVAPDLGREWMRFEMLIGYHAVHQLNACAMLFLLTCWDEKKKKKSDLDGAVITAAWIVIARADAWHQVCKECGLDAQAALVNVGCDYSGVMETAERVARAVAPTLEEVRDALTRATGEQAEPRTAESIAAEYRAVLNVKANR